jgi:hypothetical protein
MYSITRIERTLEQAHQLTAVRGHHGAMIERIDLLTASRVDCALILLPLVGWLATSVSLAISGVPAEVAARVLAEPVCRRAHALDLPPDCH